MSSLPSPSTSKTPAASNALRGLMACCFHRGSAAAAVAAWAASPAASRTARQWAILIGGAPWDERAGGRRRGACAGSPSGLVVDVVLVVIVRVVGMDLPPQPLRGLLDDAGRPGGVGLGQLEVDRIDVAALEHGVAPKPQRPDLEPGDAGRLAGDGHLEPLGRELRGPLVEG